MILFRVLPVFDRALILLIGKVIFINYSLTAASQSSFAISILYFVLISANLFQLIFVNWSRSRKLIETLIETVHFYSSYLSFVHTLIFLVLFFGANSCFSNR